MKIRIPRTDFKEALDPFETLLKPDDALAIWCEKGKIHLSGNNGGIWLDIEPGQAASDSDDVCSVSFGLLNKAVGKVTSKDIELEIKGSAITVRVDGIRNTELPLLPDKPIPPSIPSGAETTQLPTGFAGFLLQAFQSSATDNPSRPAIKGVNVSGKGVAATDGHQLASIPLPTIRMQADVTMPPSPIYQSLRKFRWTSLSVWDDKAGKRHFAIQGDGFQLEMEALDGLYPKYWTIFPDKSMLDIKAVLPRESCMKAIEFLKAVPTSNDSAIETWLYPDRLEISDCQDHRTAIPSRIVGMRLPHGMIFNAKFLLQALRLGHTTLQFNSSKPGIIMASGGTGVYAWMPFKERPELPPPSTTVSHTIATVPTTTQKEKKQMTQTSALQTTSCPQNALPEHPKTVEASPSSVSQDPLSELQNTITSMREHLDELQARLLDAGRKLREALIQQRQKERVYQDTQKRLERIRLAV